MANISIRATMKIQTETVWCKYEWDDESVVESKRYYKLMTECECVLVAPAHIVKFWTCNLYFVLWLFALIWQRERKREKPQTNNSQKPQGGSFWCVRFFPLLFFEFQIFHGTIWIVALWHIIHFTEISQHRLHCHWNSTILCEHFNPWVIPKMETFEWNASHFMSTHSFDWKCYQITAPFHY